MDNKKKVIEERFKNNIKKDRTFDEITKNWCPKTADLKNHGEVKGKLGCSVTCSECWKLAIAELVL